ncbi:MAG: VWA domain-containing protein [Acidimicrobiia bacterium]|nr:VWA domain-containing protein [Acidimicrobiia bacterium]
MTFLEPVRLLAGIPVVALAVVYVVLQARRKVYAVRFTNVALLGAVAPRRPGWRRHLAAGVFLGALALLTLAWARPAMDLEVPQERATIVMAIDVSLSMDATDITPNRIDAAQAAALEFLEVVPEPLNIGVVAFAGNASILVPPTTDRELAATAINNLQLDERTAIGEAIFTSLDAIALVPPDAEGSAPPAAIVLMSDGATNTGRSNEVAAAAARERGVPVSTIAFGTDGGTITLPGEPFPIPVPVDRDALAEIAEFTGGTFFSAVTAEELSDAYRDIGSSIGMTTELTEVSTWFVGASLVLLLASATFSLAWFSRLP